MNDDRQPDLSIATAGLLVASRAMLRLIHTTGLTADAIRNLADALKSFGEVIGRKNTKARRARAAKRKEPT